MYEYFSPPTVARTVLMWSAATRVQLERWEPLVAAHIKAEIVDGFEFPATGYWKMQYEWHFCLIAARDFMGAIDLLDPPFAVDQVVHDEIIEARDLNEHWKENLPLFVSYPRMPQPPKYRTGKSFVDRNPHDGPYGWFDWVSTKGALVTPNVPAPVLHELIDRVQARLLGEYPDMAEYIAPRAPSPWIDNPKDNEWWPR